MNVFRGACLDRGLKHIAVLPFDNVGNNPENQALTEGLVDSLSGELSNLEVGKQSLWVIPSSEVRRLKVTDPRSALRELGATLVVKGSDTREGPQVRVNMDLIDTKTCGRSVRSICRTRPAIWRRYRTKLSSKLARLMNVPLPPTCSAEHRRLGQSSGV